MNGQGLRIFAETITEISLFPGAVPGTNGVVVSCAERTFQWSDGMSSRLLKNVFMLFVIFGAFSAQALVPNPPENCRCGATARKAVCPQDVPNSVIYLPSTSLCSGKAAIVLRGPFLNSFSVVVRDSQNRDRWPAAGSGYGGCSFALANSAAPPRRCSSFKASREYIATINGQRSRVVCFPENGFSRFWTDVRRMTIKVTNSAASLRRFCLNGPRVRLN